MEPARGARELRKIGSTGYRNVKNRITNCKREERVTENIKRVTEDTEGFTEDAEMC